MLESTETTSSLALLLLGRRTWSRYGVVKVRMLYRTTRFAVTQHRTKRRRSCRREHHRRCRQRRIDPASGGAFPTTRTTQSAAPGRSSSDSSTRSPSALTLRQAKRRWIPRWRRYAPETAGPTPELPSTFGPESQALRRKNLECLRRDSKRVLGPKILGRRKTTTQMDGRTGLTSEGAWSANPMSGSIRTPRQAGRPPTNYARPATPVHRKIRRRTRRSLRAAAMPSHPWPPWLPVGSTSAPAPQRATPFLQTTSAIQPALQTSPINIPLWPTS